MVVNSMLVSMVAHSRQSASFIYHVGSSKQNPLRTSIIADCAYRYFSKSPVKGRDGKAIAVPKAYLYTSMDDFRKYMNFHYNMPLQVSLAQIHKLFPFVRLICAAKIKLKLEQPLKVIVSFMPPRSPLNRKSPS